MPLMSMDFLVPSLKMFQWSQINLCQILINLEIV